ncbi:feline leukemia virus subgroup C [Trichuris trichiura]|uniref:Feline leukemia virus subgroup C n=1 Tax=Trichuris trichiura TaxID=36087 RepID=A0A077Z1A9_TRITR|nr:feline leukemia virus subgroup C [Trichuris trichiura]
MSSASVRREEQEKGTLGELVAGKPYKDKALDSEAQAATRLYRRRWLILTIFCLLSMSNSFSWIQYSIISNIITSYYNVSYVAVDWTSLIYMVAYVPLILPATWVLDKYGLRFALILGSFGNCLGSWIKCMSASPNLFAVTFLGQTIIGSSQIFILGIPPKLAAVWFGHNEVSLATALGVFGNQLGIALGFWVPTVLVPNSNDQMKVTNGLRTLFFTAAAVTTIVFLLVLFVVSERPPRPPSLAQSIASSFAYSHKNFKYTVKVLARNGAFHLLFNTYGLNVGAFYAVSTLLNQSLLPSFPNEQSKIGLLGFLIVISGMIGSIICGWWLDRTKNFRFVVTSICIISLLGMAAYIISIELGVLWVVFLSATILGFALTGYLPLGLEYAAEVTFPVSEAMTSGMLNASAQIYGVAITLIAGLVLQKASVLACNLMLFAVLLVGTVVTGTAALFLVELNKAKLLALRALNCLHFPYRRFDQSGI